MLSATACLQTQPVLRRAKPGARPGGHLVVAIPEPRSIEPTNADAFEPGGNLVIRTLCDPLIQFDPITGDPRPAIAQSWLVSDKGSRITVKIRRGVRYHNGREVTADDVVFALSRVARRDFGSPVAPLLKPVLGYETVHGGGVGAGIDVDRRFLFQLRGARALERYSFEIALKPDEHQADFFRLLGHPLASPIPKREAEKDPAAFAKEPICTGPYQMAEPWEPGKPSIKLRRFPDYYGQNQAYTRGGRGYPESIEFRIFPSSDSQFDAFRAGVVDATSVSGPKLSEARQLGSELVVGVSSHLEYVVLPTQHEPFDNPDVRVALSQALDRQSIVASVYGGAKTPAGGILPPTLGNWYRQDACGPRAPRTGNLPAAQDSLRSSGIDLRGKSFNFYFNDEFNNRDLAEAVATQWSAAFGVHVTPMAMEWDRYIDQARGHQSFDGPFRMGWAAQYPSADTYLHPLLHSSSIGENNFSRFNDREFDRTLEKTARRAPTQSESRVAYRLLEDIACEQMPVIPIAFGGKHELVRRDALDSAVGTFVDRSTGDLLLREMFVTKP